VRQPARAPRLASLLAKVLPAKAVAASRSLAAHKPKPRVAAKVAARPVHKPLQALAAKAAAASRSLGPHQPKAAANRNLALHQPKAAANRNLASHQPKVVVNKPASRAANKVVAASRNLVASQP
jgi:hypothetical protein